MRWREKTYIDSALPIGLRSAPKVFNAVADAMQWILEQHGVKPMLHYLDDFLVIGTRECKQALETALGLCSDIPATSAGMTPDIIPTPFHVGRNVAHHLRSDLKPSLSSIFCVQLNPQEDQHYTIGPSVLCTDMGIPSLLHNPITVSEACLHSLVIGAPTSVPLVTTRQAGGYLDLGRWKQDLHGARVDPRPEEASLLQDRS